MIGYMKISTSKLALLSLAIFAQAGVAQNKSADCVQLEKLRATKSGMLTDLNEAIAEGKTKRAKCDAEANPSKKDRCIEGLQPLRDKVAALNAKISPVNDDIQKFSALCDETAADNKKTLALYESVGKDNCRAGGDQKRCEDALFNLADLSYTSDQRENLANRERYERAYDKWKDNDKQGKEPVAVAPSYSKGLAAHQRYLSSLQGGARRDVILYRTAFILDMVGRSSEAFPVLMELSTKYSTSRHIGPTNLRIGEYYFVEKKYDSAIAYYNKVDGAAAGNDGIVGLALFHKAEALYNLGALWKKPTMRFSITSNASTRDRSAAETCARKPFCIWVPALLNTPGSYGDAKKFFKGKGGRNYEDTLFYELAIKHADRDQHEQAIDALEFFLKSYPDYYKAPLAQLKLIEVWDKKKKIEEAQEAREVLIQKFWTGIRVVEQTSQYRQEGTGDDPGPHS